MNVLKKQKEIIEIKERKQEIVDNIKVSIEDMFNNLDDYSIDLNDLDFSGIFNMTNMFLECSNLSSIPNFFDNATIIGNEEQVRILKRGQ